jgi:PAS domain S-box-containing protein
MIWQWNPYALLPFTGALFLLYFIIFAWRNHANDLARKLFVALCAAALWSLAGYTIELLTTDRDSMVLIFKLQQLGTQFLATLLFLFILAYAGYERWVSQLAVVLLLIEPIFMVFMTSTNDLHHLYWADLHAVTIGSYAFLVRTFNVSSPLWIFGFLYLNALVGLGLILVTRAIIKAPPRLRPQYVFFLVSMLIPVSVNAMHTMNLSPAPHLNLVLLSLCVACLPIGWNLFHHQMVDFLPTAYDQLIHNMSDGVLIVDLQHRIIYANPAVEKVLQLPTAKLIGKTTREILTPVVPKLVDRYWDANQIQEEVVVDIVNGRSYYDLRISPLYARSGSPNGRLIVLRDITANKRSEEALANERNLLRTLIDNLPVHAYIKDTQGRFVLANHHVWRDEFGLATAQDLIGKSDFDFHIPTLAREFFADEQTIIRTGQSLLNKEEQYFDASGRKTWMLTTKIPLRGADGQISGIVGINQDITERKLADEAIRAQGLQDTTISELTSYHTYTVPLGADDDKHEWLINAFAQITGLEGDIVQWQDFVYIDDLPLIQRHLEKLRGNLSDVCELRVINRHGKMHWVRISSYPVWDEEQDRVTRIYSAVQDITERKRAEEKLRRSEVRFRTIFEQSTVGIAHVDTTGQWIRFNPKFCDIVGYTPTELQEVNWQALTYPDDVDATLAQDHRLLAKEISQYTLEKRYIRKDGTVIWVQLNSSLIQEPFTDEIYFSVIVEDITERKRTEEALTQERTLLRTLIDNIPDMIYAKDRQSRFILANIASAQNLGLGLPGDLNGKTDFDFHAPNLAHRSYSQERVLMDTGKPLINHEEYFNHPTRGKVWLSSTKVPLYDAGGNIYGLVGVGRDITEQKAREDALRESRHFVERITETMPNHVYILDLVASCVVYSNGQCLATFGYTPEELQAMGAKFPSQLIHPDDQLSSDKELVRGLTFAKDGDVLESEYRVRHKSDGWRWLYNRTTVFARLPNGTPSQILVVARDNTERRQMQAAEHEQRVLAEALRDTAAALNSTLNFDEIMDRILTNVARVVPHDSANIMLIDKGTAYIARIKDYTGTTYEQSMQGVRLVVSEAVTLQSMILMKAPLIIPDVHQYPNWVDAPESRWIRSYAAVPILVEDEVIGFLNLNSATPNFFTNDYLNRLHAFSNQCAIAIQNARLYEKARELASAEERQYLARELHDGVSQTIFSTTLIAETLPRLWERKPELVKENLGELLRLTRGSHAGMRTLLFELRPDSLLETDLATLLTHQVDVLRGKTVSTEVSIQVENNYPLPGDVKYTFYRIAQEALNNVRKHAKAKKVQVTFDSQANHARLLISDDGRGFEVGESKAGHLGLKIMQERAQTVGAHMTVESQVGQGTRIEVTWQPPNHRQ